MKRISILLAVLVTLLNSSQAHARRDGNSQFEERQRERREEKRKEKKIKKRTDLINWSASYQDLINQNARFFKRLFDRHEKGQIIGLELVIASSSWSNIESGFGHTMLRFVDNIGEEGDDVVLSFVANMDSLKLNYFKGIFGGYPVFPQVKSLRMFMDDYTNNQRRDLDRYIIISDKEIRERIIAQLKEQWQLVVNHQLETRKEVLQTTVDNLKKYSDEKFGEGKYGVLPLKSLTGALYALSAIPRTEVPTQTEENKKLSVEQIFPIMYSLPESSELGDYTFFSNNCAGALVNFFKQVGLPYHKKLGLKGRIPLTLPDYLQRAMINPYPIIKIHSLRELKKKVVKITGIKDESYLQYDLSVEQVKKLEKKLNKKEMRKLIEIVAFDLDSFKYYESVMKGIEKMEFDELHGLTKVPVNLYRICKDDQCIADVKKDLKDFYGETKFSEIQKKNIKKSKKAVTRWKQDHRTKRRIQVAKRPYKGLLVNEDILNHQSKLQFLHERWTETLK